MRNMMEKMMSKKDVILCRGIWYVMTLLSIFGLSISLNLLWSPGDSSSSSSSRFLRDGAVSATTFYAVTLLRYFFFTDPLDPSTCYRKFTTELERLPQLLFSIYAILLVFVEPLWCSALVKNQVWFVLYMSLFTISLVIGGIGLIQLSDKLRMEMKHALFTVYFVCVFSPLGLFVGLYSNDNPGLSFFLSLLCCLCLVLFLKSCTEDLDPPLPA